MKSTRSKFHNLAAIAAFTALAAVDAMAQSAGKSVGDVAKNVSKSLDGSVTLVNSAAYLIGAICCFAAIMLFKKNREDPRSEPIGKALGVGLAGIFLLFLPEMINSGQQTVWGGNATQTTQGQTTLR